MLLTSIIVFIISIRNIINIIRDTNMLINISNMFMTNTITTILIFRVAMIYSMVLVTIIVVEQLNEYRICVIG